MRSLALKLAPGQDLRLSLETLAKAHQVSGYVLGVVGNLSCAAFRCPGQPAPTVLEGDLEIITLQGNFSPDGAHLHLSLSDGACQVWGGHLEAGTLILKGADLLVGLLDQPLPQVPTSLEPPQPIAAPLVQQLSVQQPVVQQQPVIQQQPAAQQQPVQSLAAPQPVISAPPVPRVEVAVLPGCPWCTRALRILRSLDIAHSVVTCDSDAVYHALYQRSAMSVFPQVFIDGAVLGGYDDLAQLHGEGALAQFR
ncbi:MAG: PCC domain-containing protein [Synechococcus sp.]